MLLEIRSLEGGCARNGAQKKDHEEEMTLAERIAKLKELQAKKTPALNGNIMVTQWDDSEYVGYLRNNALAIIEELDAKAFQADSQWSLAEDRIVELEAERVRLREFASFVMFHLFDGHDIDGGSTQDEAERLGLIELRPIDPEDSIDGEIEHYFLVWAPK